MTKINKIIAIAIIISNFSCTLFAQQAVSASSTTEGAGVSRLTSSSFGSKSGSAGGGLADVTTGSPLLQEQTFGGLTYQVHILGEVNKPGTYRVPASTRLSEAIQIAGDILERGSNRRIEIKRENSKNQKVDLNAFKQFGDLNSNPYLLDNDTIFVPLQGKVVQMVGSVVRPGVYELLNEKNIQDLLSLVGGFASGLDRNVPLKIIRYVNGDKIIINVVNDDEHRKDFILENADVIVAPHFFLKNKKFDYNLTSLPGEGAIFVPSYDSKIFVLGAVFKPGAYAFTTYYGVRQYLTLAGGTNKLAKNKKIKIITSDGKTVKARNNTVMSPGDTIVVPEKYLPPEGLLSLILGLTTSVLGVTTTVLTLTR